MPRVEQGRQTQLTQIVQGPRAQAAPASAFGGQVGRGLTQLGQGLQQFQQRADQTSAEEALTEFQRRKNDLFFNPDSGYFNQQGKNAYDGAQAVSQSLEDLKNEFVSGIESDGARQLFTRAADTTITRSNAEIQRHAARGLQAWEVATSKAQVENAVESASLYWGDNEQLNLNRELGRMAVTDAAEREGITGEALAERLQTFNSGFNRAAIESAANTSSEAAEQLLQRIGGDLEPPDRARINNLISRQKQAEETQRRANYAIDTATGLVARYEQRKDIIAEVNKIQDPQLRKQTMAEATRQFDLRQRAEKEAQGDIFEDVERMILDGGSVEDFKARNPRAWGQLSPKQQRSLTKGEPVKTDFELLSDLLTLPENQLAKVDPSDHFDSLGESDRRSLIRAVKAARNEGSSSDRNQSQVGRSRTAETTAKFEEFFGDRKRDWSQTDRKKANRLYDHIDAQVRWTEEQLGRPVNSQEYSDILNGSLRSTVIKGTFYDDKIGLNNVKGSRITAFGDILRDQGVSGTGHNIAVLNELADEGTTEIQFEQYAQVIGFLESRGKPVTPENVRAAFSQATSGYGGASGTF